MANSGDAGREPLWNLHRHWAEALEDYKNAAGDWRGKHDLKRKEKKAWGSYSATWKECLRGLIPPQTECGPDVLKEATRFKLYSQWLEANEACKEALGTEPLRLDPDKRHALHNGQKTALESAGRALEAYAIAQRMDWGPTPFVIPAEFRAAEVHQEAIARLQDTVKWLLSSAAAVAVVLLAGVEFGDIAESVPPWKYVAIVLTFAALGGIAGALWNAGRVLVAKPVTLDELFEPRSTLLSGNPSDVPSDALTPRERRHPFRRVRETLRFTKVGGVQLNVTVLSGWRARRTALEKWNVMHRRQAVLEKEPVGILTGEAELSALDDGMKVAEAITGYRAVKGAYSSARLWLVFAIALGFAALVATVLSVPPNEPADEQSAEAPASIRESSRRQGIRHHISFALDDGIPELTLVGEPSWRAQQLKGSHEARKQHVRRATA